MRLDIEEQDPNRPGGSTITCHSRNEGIARLGAHTASPNARANHPCTHGCDAGCCLSLPTLFPRTGGMTQAQYDDPMAASNRPFWDAGLDGEGEVVGVGDTGLDLDHCFCE